mmetsp:Transcript_17975/g.57947  ORF Transcript_17975/g.57947 Transcript_17975/m.57947 type:complete len:203 (+) Transcript_17975:774-1382(+)
METVREPPPSRAASCGLMSETARRSETGAVCEPARSNRRTPAVGGSAASSSASTVFLRRTVSSTVSNAAQSSSEPFACVAAGSTYPLSALRTALRSFGAPKRRQAQAMRAPSFSCMMCTAAPCSVPASTARWPASECSRRSAKPRCTIEVTARPLRAALERVASIWRRTRGLTEGSAANKAPSESCSAPVPRRAKSLPQSSR